jgi:hypothetical protein
MGRGLPRTTIAPFLQMLNDPNLCLSNRPQCGSNLDICGDAWHLLERTAYLAGFDPVSGFALFVEVAQYQKANIKNQNDKSKSKNQTNPSIKIQRTIEILKPKH